MPIAGRLYDRVGARWPATIGLVIVTVATYLMHGLTATTSREEIIALLAVRAVGMGLAMMPVMTGGIAAVEPALVGAAGAFNNVVQRVSAALGLAILTAFMTNEQAQYLNDRSGLVTSATQMPSLGPGPEGQMLGTVAVYQQTQTLTFVSALDDLMVVNTLMSVVAVGLALLLRSGKRAPAGSGADAAAAVH